MKEDNEKSSSSTKSDEVEAISGFQAHKRGKLLRYAGKLPEELVVKSIARAIDYFYKNRNKHSNQPKALLIYAGFLAAVDRFHYADTTAMKRKDSDLHLPLLEEIREARLREYYQGRPCPATNIVRQYLPEVNDLRNKGWSWRRIEEWLWGQYQVKVSRETLRTEVGKCRK